MSATAAPSTFSTFALTAPPPVQEEEENFKSKHPTNQDSAVQLSTHSVTNNSTINLSTPGNSTEKEETQPGL